MDLLSMLMSSMTNQSSVDAIAKKSGGSSKGINKLLLIAIPLIIGYLTKNAKASSNGTSSLLGALQQHTSTEPVSSQIANADTADGAAILNHIFGSDYSNVTNNLAGQTGMSQQQVASALSSMAPALMSGLSAATTSASNAQQSAGSGFNLADGLDLSDIAALMGGASNSKPQSSSSLLGSLLGGGSSSSSSSSGLGSLLGGLMGGGSSNSSAGSSLLGSLLGGGNSAANQNALNGVDLLSALLGGK